MQRLWKKQKHWKLKLKHDAIFSMDFNFPHLLSATSHQIQFLQMKVARQNVNIDDMLRTNGPNLPFFQLTAVFDIASRQISVTRKNFLQLAHTNVFRDPPDEETVSPRHDELSGYHVFLVLSKWRQKNPEKRWGKFKTKEPQRVKWPWKKNQKQQFDLCNLRFLRRQLCSFYASICSLDFKEDVV